MYTVPQILTSAGVRYNTYPNSPAPVFLTAANQLIGTYRNLTWFRAANPQYSGKQTGSHAEPPWEVHHIVEDQDWDRLSIRERVPPYEQQICVLLPWVAHQKRINSIFRQQNPSSIQAVADDFKAAYREAYALLGDYCGAGEAAICHELVSIVLAVYRWARL